MNNQNNNIEVQNILHCLQMLYDKSFILYSVDDFSIIKSDYQYDIDKVFYISDTNNDNNNIYFSLINLVKALLQNSHTKNNLIFNSMVCHKDTEIYLLNEIIKWYDDDKKLNYIILTSEKNVYLTLNPYNIIMNSNVNNNVVQLKLSDVDKIILQMYLHGLTYLEISTFLTNELRQQYSIKMVGNVIRNKIHPFFQTSSKIELLEILTSTGYQLD